MKLILSVTDKVLIGTLIAIIGVQLVCVVWQFLSRYFLGTPSTMTEEIAQLLLMWLGFLGAAYVLGQRKHLAIHLLGNLQPGLKRRPDLADRHRHGRAFFGGCAGLWRRLAGT